MATMDDIIDLVKVQLSSSAEIVSSDGYELAAAQASSELGWNFPVTDPTRIMWLVKRTTRHACNILKIASAQKFKYKQVSLNQRFEHYVILLADMDSEFETALSQLPAVFAGVETHKMFGTALNAGYTYNYLGEDTTYEDDISKLINI
jgi:hypothetical protein